jgi:SWI/SNF-related matrix-associated actin-dependent regulator of chromatin subfamily A-like protein 1
MILTVNYDPERRLFKIAVPGGQQVPAINDWPGWRRYPNGVYMAPAWPSSIVAMTKTTAHSLQWDVVAAQERDRLMQDLHLMRTALTRDPWAPGPLPTERRPKLHQRQAVGAIRYAHWRVLLADDMGLGKTSSALWAADDAGCKHVLVICPVSVKFNWQNEIYATLGNEWFAQVIDGSVKKRAQQLVDVQSSMAEMERRDLANRSQVHHVGTGNREDLLQIIDNCNEWAIIINYDLLRHLSEDQRNWLAQFVSEGMLLLDESHYLKGRDTERTKLVAKIAEKARYVIAMTGTPIRNLADDLYSQVEIVRPGTWTSYRDFAKRHLVIQSVKFGKRDVQKVVGVRNLDALNAVMNTLQIKRAKHEVLDLPPKTYTYPELQLEGELLKVYKAMKEFAKIELRQLCSGAAPEQRVNIFDPRARSAVEQAMRCEQIAQGFIGGIPQPIMDSIGPDILKLAEKIPGRPNELMFPTAPKVVWMLETIESVLKQGGAPIVGCRFNAPLLWIANHLGKQGLKAWVLHGGLSAAEKHDVVASFQEGRIDVMLVQVKIAEGWNATRCQDVIHWTRDWSPAINSQFEDRAHRMGQKGTVNVQVPIVRNSIEMMIHRRLTAKQADAAQALRTVTIEELMEAL